MLWSNCRGAPIITIPITGVIVPLGGVYVAGGLSHTHARTVAFYAPNRSATSGSPVFPQNFGSGQAFLTRCMDELKAGAQGTQQARDSPGTFTQAAWASQGLPAHCPMLSGKIVSEALTASSWRGLHSRLCVLSTCVMQQAPEVPVCSPTVGSLRRLYV